ncbi:membrane bound O-acyl transferase family-domain-containing protein [Podospora didyma]|uniref:Membrane bound O-acyl transferase family-domain-containing protein n=1 Tax=Podospora didyma TaxID=330526 RepID=A0AAE0N297_9PEZI|nr:membrane bound O-acyl transferase family-domain-containing protein [Podospora didyma]
MDSDGPLLELSQYQSVAFLFLANVVIFAAIYAPNNLRPGLLIPTWSFFGISFMTLHRLPLGRELLSNLGIYLTIASLLWPIGLFTAEPLMIQVVTTTSVVDDKSPPPMRYRYYFWKWNWNLRQAYRIYNNPRKLPDRFPPSSPPTTRALFWFAARRLAQTAGLLLLHTAVTLFCATIGGLGDVQADDFSPAHEPLLSSFFHCWQQGSRRHLRIRASVLLYWVTHLVIPLQAVHFLLSIVFVSLLRVDAPDEWPPLFSSPLQAYSLKRYWGVFWHRLFSPGAVIWARFVARKGLGLPPGGVLEKALVPFIVFSVSGVAHAAVGWRLGYVGLDRDIKFFLWNFAGIFGEVALLRGVRAVLGGRKITSIRQGYGGILLTIVTRIVGYFWVVVFLLWAMPPYLYPKLYDSLLQKEVVEQRVPAIDAGGGWE